MTQELSPYWDGQVLRASASVRSLRIGDRVVLFDEKSQKLYEQNTPSADLWEALVGGRNLATACLDVAQAPAYCDERLKLARPAVLEWLRSGFLQPADWPTPAPATAVVLEWLSCRLTVELPADLQSVDLKNVFRNFLSDEACSNRVRLQLTGDLVFFNDGAGGCYARHLDEWIPEVKAIFTARILDCVADGFLMHTALVSRRGAGLLLCGPSGMGKSTLSLALALNGFGYHADDIVQFARSGEAVGAAFAPALKEGSWAHFERMTGAASMHPTYLRTDGNHVRYVDLPSVEREPIAIGAILVLERGRSGPARIEPIEPLNVLTSILQSAYSARGTLAAPNLEVLVHCIQQARVGRLIYSDWSDAVQTISDFAP